ncbi:MAG: rod shape-determining protein MreD [Hyphomicrobiaceae bacterium]
MTAWLARPALTGGAAVTWYTVWRAILPGASLVLAVLIAAAPGGQGAFPAAALVPVMVIFYWVVTGARGLPVALVFLAGLVLDAVSFGPLGAWALIYVAVALLAAAVADFANAGLAHRTAMLAGCLGLASGLQLVLLVLFDAALPSPGQVGQAIALAVAVYPVLAAVLRVATVQASGPHAFDREGRP